MYITTGTSRRYTVLDTSIQPGEVRYTLAEAPAELGASVNLWTEDGGLCLRTEGNTSVSNDSNGGQRFVVIYGTTKYIVGQNNVTATVPTALELTFTWDGESVSWKGRDRGWATNYNNNNYDWLIIG